MVDPAPINSGGNLDFGAPAATEFTRTRGDLERWRAGDASAFDELWRRYRPALEILIAGRIRSSTEPALRARLDGDDVLQEVAITVFGKLGEFEYRGPGSVLAWMSMIAKRTVSDWVDYWRAGKRHPRVELPRASPDSGATTNGSATTFVDQAQGQATQLAVRERRLRLAAAMASLSEREHLIVLWRFFGGAAWTEIAAELGAPSADAVRKECCLRVFPALAAALAQR
ncbi:MAG: sigma-70 family RNA polymerase sigma factor [Planctomycetota bacterium]